VKPIKRYRATRAIVETKNCLCATTRGPEQPARDVGVSGVPV